MSKLVERRTKKFQINLKEGRDKTSTQKIIINVIFNVKLQKILSL